MLYLIYDAALNGSQQLYALIAKIKHGNMLLHPIYDKGLEWNAPWIFSLTEEDLEWISKENWSYNSYYLIESKANINELNQIFRSIIYNKSPEHSKTYFRCWDLEVILTDTKKEHSLCKRLFQFIDQIYVITEDNMKVFYMDDWGILNQKTMEHILGN